MDSKQRFRLRKIIKELGSHRARHTELVSVYIPPEYEIVKVQQQLAQEAGTARNIKSAGTRKNVQDALERMIRELRLYKRTPPNGLAAFSGNVSPEEGKSDVRVWSVEPPLPIHNRLYRCGPEFFLDPLIELTVATEAYGLVVMDRSEANIALLKGKSIIPVVHFDSMVPGKSRAGGQCLAQDTLVQLSDGRIASIQNIHNPLTLKSVLMTDFSLLDSPVIDQWEVNKRQAYRIITKYPRLDIQASGDHTFFVAAPEQIEQRTASELRVGDYLIMPEQISVSGKVQKLNSKKYYNSFQISDAGRAQIQAARKQRGLLQRQLAKELSVTQTAISTIELGKRTVKRTLLKKICDALDIDFLKFLDNSAEPFLYHSIRLPTQLTPEFAQFLGYLAGDGNLEKDRVAFSEQSADVASYYKKKFDRVFNVTASYRFRRTKNYHQLRFTSRPLVRLIREEFPELKQEGKIKHSLIPEKILLSPNAVLYAFLRGFFDAEGYASARNRVAFGINDKLLAQQIQLALLRFGILASLHEYDNRANIYSDSPRFTLDITEKQSLELFSKHIGFSSPEKAEKLEQILRRKTNKSSVRQIIAPGRRVREIAVRYGYNIGRFPKVSNFFRNERMISKQAFESSILSCIENTALREELKKICEYQALPVKIHKIALITGASKMVDISVQNQNFIANGLVVHNSAQRFERVRENLAKDFYKKVGDAVNKALGELKLKGILVGGPGPTKESFVNGNFLSNPIKEKILGILDIGYTGDAGVEELVNKGQDILAKEEIAEEKQIVNRFMTRLSTQPENVAYGIAAVEKALACGAVDLLLISEEMDEETTERLAEKTEEFRGEWVVISKDTKEGQLLINLGKVGAILRFRTE